MLLDKIIGLKKDMEQLIYNYIDELLHNVSELTDQQAMSLADTIIHNKYYNHPLFYLIDRLKQIKIKPDTSFAWVSDMLIKSLNNQIKTLEEIEQNKYGRKQND